MPTQQKQQIYAKLHWLKNEAPALLKEGKSANLRKVLKCRLWVDEQIGQLDEGYAWWLFITGDVACAKHRNALLMLSLDESVKLGATDQLSWYSPVWQKYEKRGDA